MRLEKETSVFKRNALATAITNALGRATKFIAELSNGIFVHAEGTPSDPTDTDAVGVYITDKVDIIKDGDSVASYGDATTIGKESSKHVFIDADSLDIMDGDVALGSFGSDGISLGEKEMLSIAPNGATRDLYREESFGTINLPATIDVSTGNVYGLVEDGDTMRVMTKPFLWRVFQKGTPHTRTADDVTVEYDGGSIFVVTSETLTSCVFYFKGVVEHQKCGVFTFGDRTPGAKGSFSSTFGEGLIAIANDQFVIGRYNNSDTNKVFIVGCGTGNEDRSNVFTINSIGNIESADGFKSKKETYIITTTNAESIMGAKRSGIVMLTIKNINNLASGDNVVGTLPSDLKPTMPVYMPFGKPSYTPLLRLYISSNDNNVHVYNYSSAITSDSNASVTVTYIAV